MTKQPKQVELAEEVLQKLFLEMDTEFEEKYGDNPVYWQELMAEIHIGDPDFTSLRKIHNKFIRKAFEAGKAQAQQKAVENLENYQYEDWKTGNDGTPRVGDFIELFFEYECNGYHQDCVRGVIVLDKHSDYGKNQPIILLENGEWDSIHKAWNRCSGVTRVKPTKDLIDHLVQECSFNDYPEFKALQKEQE